MSTSKGNCAIVNHALSCASGNTAESFTLSNGYLAASGSTSFYVSAKASGQTQETVWDDYGSVSLKLAHQSV